VLNLDIHQPAQTNGRDCDVFRDRLGQIHAFGVVRVFVEFEFADHRLDERPALEVLVLGLEVILFAAVHGEDIFDVQYIVRFAVDLDAG